MKTFNPPDCVITRIADLVFHNMIHDRNRNIPFTKENDKLHDALQNGLCSIPGNENAGSDADEASFDCVKGPGSASWLIK